jgi:hypothetical protein
MQDKDKKVVNTEEQYRAVNPGDSNIEEESISQDPIEDKNGYSSGDDENNEGRKSNDQRTTQENT